MTTLLEPEATSDAAVAGGADPTAGAPATTSSDGGPPARLRRLWILPAGVVVVAALALLPRVGDAGPGPGEARVVVDGTASVVRDDGVATTVTDDSVALGPGDVLEVVAGSARFTLADEVHLEGRAEPSVGGRQGTTVEMQVVPELLAGPLLVEAPTTAVRVAAAGSTTTVGPAGDGGAARLLRRLGLGVGSYGGAVEVDSAGRRAAVAPWRRAEVAAVGEPGPTDLALRYSAQDPWDRRFLADALTIDRQLAPLLRGLDGAGAPDLTDPATLRAAVPGLPGPVALAPRLDEVADSGEALVLAALATTGTGGSLGARWDASAAFRADGAAWGLVAVDQGVAPADLLGTVRTAIDDALAAAPGGAADTGTPAGAGADDEAVATPDAALAPVPTTAGPAGGATGTGSPTGDGAPGAGAGGAATPPGTTGAGGGGIGGGTGDGTGGVGTGLPGPDDVGGAVDGVGGAVDGAADGVGGLVTGAGGTAGDVVGGAGGAVGGPVGGTVTGLGGTVTGVTGTGGAAVDDVGDLLGGVVTGLGSAGSDLLGG